MNNLDSEMNQLNNLNYNGLTIEAFPEGEYTVDWYNNISQNLLDPCNYYIKLVLRNTTTNEIKVIDCNIETIPNFSLGSIIKDKQHTSQKIGKLYNFSFLLTNPQTIQNIPSKYFNEHIQYFNGLNRIISLSNSQQYNLGFHSSTQYGISLTNEGNTVFFPAYVIAQYFYFRSRSLIDRVLPCFKTHADAVKSLYTELYTYGDGDIEITLPSHISPNDAPEIMRFNELNSYGATMFQRIYIDLAMMQLKNKAHYAQKGWAFQYNSAALKVYFPILGNINMTFRGVMLADNEYLALEIIQENSAFPFDKLTVYKESLIQKNRVTYEGVFTKYCRAQNITHQVTDLTSKIQ